MDIYRTAIISAIWLHVAIVAFRKPEAVNYSAFIALMATLVIIDASR